MIQRYGTSIDIELRNGMAFRAVGEDGVEVVMDADREHGGVGGGLRPMELMLASLGTCSAMDVISILRKKRQRVTGYRVELSGTRATEHPHVFTSIAIRHVIRGHDVDAAAVDRAIELSETKYCPAYAMLSKAVSISSSFEIHPAGPVD